MCNLAKIIVALIICATRTSSATTGVDLQRQSNVTVEISDHLCDTPVCINSAQRIQRNMNLDALPCDDFYEFACGNFMKTVEIPVGYAEVSPQRVAAEEIQSRLQEIVETIDESKAPKHFRLVKRFYENCMTSLDSNLDEDHVQSALLEINMKNGWPLKSGEDWRETEFDYRYTFRSLFRKSLAPDLDNRSLNSLQLQVKDPPLARSYLTSGNEVGLRYHRYMVDIAVALGAKEPEAIGSLANTFILEMELQRTVFTEHDDQDLKNRLFKTTLGELDRKYPKLNAMKAFGKPPETVVQMTVDWGTMERLENWVIRTPKRALANWEAWRFFAKQAPTFGGFFTRRTQLFNRILTGTSKGETKSEYCISRTQNSLGFALGALYQRKYVSQTSLDDLSLMFDKIKAQFSGFIEKAQWLDGDTKRDALEKVSSVKSSLVTCREPIGDDELEAFYRDLELSDDSFDENLRNITKFEAKKKSDNTLTKMSRAHCGHFLIDTKYSPRFNFIQLAATLYTDWNLDINRPTHLYGDVLYDVGRPKYLNYGAAGGVIGHEIAHSLGVSTRYYNKNGNLKLTWDSESNKNYLNRSQCFVYQYGNYTVDEFGIRLNGFSTRDENIADNSGVKAAYYAYLEWAKNAEREKSLPGLNYPPNQMFWIAMANSFCTKYRPEYLKSRIYQDVHSPNKFRVNGPLANLQEFSNDFKCDSGTKMNPKNNKCLFW